MLAILIVFLSGRGKSLLLLVVRVFTFVLCDTLWFGGITHSLGISALGTSFYFWKYISNFFLTKARLLVRYADDYFLFLSVMSPVFFLVVSSPGYLQAGEHQGQHTLRRWISRDHGLSGGWQNRCGAQSSQQR